MKKKYRVETDLMGPIQLPRWALWGSHTARALQNFQTSGQCYEASLIRAYLRIKHSGSLANFECGQLSERKFTLINKAVQRLLGVPEKTLMAHFPVEVPGAGAGTDLNMNVNEVIANLANFETGRAPGTYFPIHPNDDVNQSHSTNDTFPTALRLAALETSLPLREALSQLAASLKKKGREWHLLPKAARTHLQDAVPMRLGEEVFAYGLAIERCALWVEKMRDPLRELGLGGSAAGTGLNVPRDYPSRAIAALSRSTGESLRVTDNFYEAMQSQSAISRFAAELKTTSLELTRICNDLRLLSSGPETGIGEIRLPLSQPGSSIMPGKMNPSILEMCNQTWFAVLGHEQTIAFAAQAGQLELNVMLPQMAHSLLTAIRIMRQATQTLTHRCIERMEPNRPRLKHYFESTPQVATALSPYLGYDATGRLVQEAYRAGCTVVEQVRSRQLLSRQQLDSILDPEQLTGRISSGIAERRVA